MNALRLLPILVLALLALTAPAATAQGSTQVACGIVPGSVTGNTTVPSIQSDVLDGNLFDQEAGTFTFDGPAECDEMPSGANAARTAVAPATVAPMMHDLVASGTWVNTVCGSGSANGSANLSAGGTTNLNMSFFIQFDHTRGTLSLSNISGRWRGRTIADGFGDGVIQITPAEGSCVTGPGVTAWNVNGAFEMVLEHSL